MSRELEHCGARPPEEPLEERIVATNKAAKQKKIDDAVFALERLSSRSRAYRAEGPRRDNDLAIVRHRQDMRLDELNDLNAYPTVTEEVPA